MKINNEDELIEKFAAKLIEDKGGISDEGEKEAEIARIVDQIDDRFIDEIIDRLPEDKQRALDELAEKEEEIPEHVLNAIIFGAKLDYSGITKKILETYRKEYLGEGA